MTFLLPQSVPPTAESLLGQACFAGGYDLTPSPTRVRIENGRLLVSREHDESANLFLPWPIGPVGAMVTTPLRRPRSAHGIYITIPAMDNPKLASLNGKSVRMSPTKVDGNSTRLWKDAERGAQ